jgi:hypothetical protein
MFRGRGGTARSPGGERLPIESAPLGRPLVVPFTGALRATEIFDVRASTGRVSHWHSGTAIIASGNRLRATGEGRET